MKKGRRSSFKEDSVEMDYPLLKDIIPDDYFEPSTENEMSLGKDSLKVIKALLNGEISKEDYRLWLLELEKKYPEIKPLSFKEASRLLEKKKRFMPTGEYKGVKYH